MTTLDEAPAVTTAPLAGPAATPRLNAALAAAQAEMPLISKDSTGEIKGVDKYGKPFSYKYNYADLAAICAIAYPIIGKHGLAFSSQPTFNAEGRFVLEYQLLHESGEEKRGTMPLPAQGKPQELGSVLTYFKRYAFTAVTGIAPGGEDNDAATANHSQRYDSGQNFQDAWESAAPAAPRGQQRESSRPAAPARAPRPPAAAPAPELTPDDDWRDTIAGIMDAYEAASVSAEVAGLRAAETITEDRARQLDGVIAARVAALGVKPPGIRAEDQGRPAVAAMPGEDPAWIQQFSATLGSAQTEDDIVALTRQLSPALAKRTITPKTATDLRAACGQRRRDLANAPELAGAPA